MAKKLKTDEEKVVAYLKHVGDEGALPAFISYHTRVKLKRVRTIVKKLQKEGRLKRDNTTYEYLPIGGDRWIDTMR